MTIEESTAPISAPIVVADPHALIASGIEVADLYAMAELLRLSKRSTREILREKWEEIRYIDRRAEGVALCKTRLYCVADVAKHMPAHAAWRERCQAEGRARDAARTAEARAAKAIRLAAKPAKPAKGKPAPKPTAPAKPREPRPMPPMLSRDRRGPPEVYRASPLSRGGAR